MKSEQIKHFLSVGPKSIQSRVYNADTNEKLSFVKILLKDSGLVHREWQDLTDDEITEIARPYKEPLVFCYRDFARSIESKLKEKNG